MADTAWERNPAPARHTALVRATHGINALCFFALLVSGVEILISHPRFYWGEAGNVNTQPLFQIPIPASRAAVPTGYSYVLPDQNGWSRALHFQSAWLIFFTGCLYVLSSLLTRHVQRDLLPARKDLSWSILLRSAASDDPSSYNALQRLAYLAVVFLLLPLLVWTGLAMAPVFTSAWPGLVTAFGGRQSARTLHFFLTLVLTGFFLGHLFMVWRAGFVSRVRAMLTGRLSESKEDA
jgi:thiosulfate reductase cytochrome b subunit